MTEKRPFDAFLQRKVLVPFSPYAVFGNQIVQGSEAE
jgi:hypothetical protein